MSLLLLLLYCVGIQENLDFDNSIANFYTIFMQKNELFSFLFLNYELINFFAKNKKKYFQHINKKKKPLQNKLSNLF